MTRRRTALRLAGGLLILAGGLVALFTIYQLTVTDVVNAHRQTTLRHALQREWAVPAPRSGATSPAARRTPPLGDGIAILHIPRIAPHYAQVVVEGVTVAALRRGPGHYPGTAAPGRVGNFVVSGHRTTYGAPFRHLDVLRAGDPIVVETRNAWFVYAVTGHEIVAPDRIDVVAAVPGHPDARPTAARLTLTTCHPVYSARDRLVVFGALVATRPRSAGPPPQLAAPA